MKTHSSPEGPLWLFSRCADFWLACGGASVGLLAAVLIILWHGDRELDALDFVLSEFHLGATYGAMIRRRLWRHRQVDVLLIPLVILALTYAFSMTGQTILLTSIAMYAAVWHRGRQSLGVARFYQRGMGGPVSRAHDCLFRGAIYLPMLAGMLAYTHLAPIEYEGEPYLALSFGKEITSIVGFAAAAWVTAYLIWALWPNCGERVISAPQNFESSGFDVKQGSEIAPRRRGGRRVNQFLTKKFSELCERCASVVNTFSQETRNNQNFEDWVHPGEWWVVLAHAVAFGSGYVLGASNASFLLVLAVHHEVQYLYFTYAMARHSSGSHTVSEAGIDAAPKNVHAKASNQDGPALRTEAGHAASFLVWPIIGFVGAIVGGWSQLKWLAPLGMGGLFCHYWLDGRIWTRRSFEN